MKTELINQTNYKGLENVINLYNNITILFIGICNLFKKWFKLGKKLTPSENPTPTSSRTDYWNLQLCSDNSNTTYQVDNNNLSVGMVIKSNDSGICYKIVNQGSLVGTLLTNYEEFSDCQSCDCGTFKVVRIYCENCLSKELSRDNCKNEITINTGEHCDRNPNWVNDGEPYCLGDNRIQNKIDNNPCSSSFNQVEQINLGSLNWVTNATYCQDNVSKESQIDECGNIRIIDFGNHCENNISPLPMYREVLLSNPNGESTAKNCCKITTGLPKYIDYTVEISAGLVIYNDIALTERTYTTNPYGNKYAMIYDPIGANGVNGGKRFSVKFDSNGTVNNHIDCITKIPNPTPTLTSICVDKQILITTFQNDIDASDDGRVYYKYQHCTNGIITYQTPTVGQVTICDEIDYVINAYILVGGQQTPVSSSSMQINGNCDTITEPSPTPTASKPTVTPQIAYEYEAIRCGDELKTKIIANNPNLKQNVYSLSQENINTCYTIISEPIEINGIGSTYYLIGNCSDNRCAQL